MAPHEENRRAGRITETSRLVLREIVSADLDAFARLFADPEVMRYSLGTRNREETRGWIEAWQGRYAEYGWGLWAVERSADGAMLGYCGLIPQKIDDVTEVEVGYRLLPEAWGQGYGTEAARAVRDHAFGTLGLRRLISIIEPRNVRSIRVAEKNGMRLERELTWRGKLVRVYAVDAAPGSS